MTTAAVNTGGRARVGRTLLWGGAVAAVAAAASSLSAVVEADRSTVVLELWRGYGLLVFAGLFALLAARRQSSGALWAVVIVNKVALAMTGLALLVLTREGPRPEGAADLLLWDGALSILLVVAFVCCREPRPDRSTATLARAG